MIKILANIDNFLQLTSVLLVILFPGNLREFGERSCKFHCAFSFTHFFLLSSVPGVWSGWTMPVVFALCLMVNSCNGKAMARHRGWVAVGWGGCVCFPFIATIVLYQEMQAPISLNSFTILPIPLSFAFSLRVVSTLHCPKVCTISSWLPKPRSYGTTSLLNFYSYLQLSAFFPILTLAAYNTE